jgi:acyl carrier protein
MVAPRFTPPLHLKAASKGIALMQQETQTAQRIRSFIEENFLFGQAYALQDSDSFLDGGVLDSTGILQLIAFLGETYGITVADEEVIPDNLDSIDKISAYLHRKWDGTGRAGEHQ